MKKLVVGFVALGLLCLPIYTPSILEVLATCPGGIWDITNDDFGVTSITFLYEEEAGEES